MSAQTLATADFLVASQPPSLAQDEIHVWFFPQWENGPAATQSPQLRSLLAAYLDGAASELRIERGPYGKPYLVDADLQFNLSHSGGALLLGVSRGHRLGVDLESARRRTRSVSALAQRWFSAAEALALERFPPPQRQIQFLRLWTAKEALVKARGNGIGAGLHLAAFDNVDGAWICADPAWQVMPLAPSADWLAALAWRGSVSRVHAFVAPGIAPPA